MIARHASTPRLTAATVTVTMAALGILANFSSAGSGAAPSAALAGKQPVETAAASPSVRSIDQRGDAWMGDFDSAALWRISNNTFLDYLVLPQMVSLRTPAHIRLALDGDRQLLVRARFTLLAEAIVEGPENHYFGFSCSPSIEYWMSPKTYLYCSVGGGVGAIDSQGVPGGQGQDLTYNWFAMLGVRHYFTDSFAAGFGVMFQHFSNRGATDPNPGLDAFGPMVGFSWEF